MRTFLFDDGQTWHMELTRRTHEVREGVTFGARFWSDTAPDQQVLGRVSTRGLALHDRELACALRQALLCITSDAELDT